MGKSTPLEALERIAGNLPIVGDRKYRFVDTLHGRIRFAYGVDGRDRYHGVWAVDDRSGVPLMGRTIEFGDHNTEKLVVAELLRDATEFLNALHVRGLTQPEVWRNG